MVLSKFPIFSRNLPLVNLVIATSALGFQITVLYPWHLEIDSSHKDLIKKMEEHEKLLEKGNRVINPNIIETSNSIKQQQSIPPTILQKEK